MLLFCVDGKVESLWEGKTDQTISISLIYMSLGIVTIFSWAEPDKHLHRFEFHYFLDSLFRGLFGLLVLKSN